MDLWTPWGEGVPICEAWFLAKTAEGDGWHPCIVLAADASNFCPTHKEALENGDSKVSPNAPDEMRRPSDAGAGA